MLQNNQINIFIAEDTKLISDLLVESISNHPKLKFVGRAANGDELLKKIKNYTVDILLLDIRMPILNGLDALPKIRQKYPLIKVIMLSQFNERSYVSESLKQGASGYISKNLPKEKLHSAIIEVHNGGIVLEVDSNNAEPPKPVIESENSILTKTEKKVLFGIINELNSQEIADLMGIKVTTVETHRRNIMSKLGVKNMAGMVREAIEQKLCEGITMEDLKPKKR